ncbi:MAG: formate dehydrogenase subunit gamma [Stappiaceae bacterium]
MFCLEASLSSTHPSQNFDHVSGQQSGDKSVAHIVRRALIACSFVFVFLSLGVLSLDPAHAQVSGPDKPVAGAVPGNTTAGSSADADLWRQIRQGAQGTVAGQNSNSGLMIQSEGYLWQQTRNGPLAMYSAWGILGILMLLSLFYALRGRIRIDQGPSGKTMKRFSGIERAGHWLLASSFILLALTGLNLLFGRTLLIPIIGHEAFSTITIFGKFIHNYVGFAFMVALVIVAVLWIVHNIPNRYDLVWFLRGGGLLGGGHPKARKFNGGQKALFWLIILGGASISLSGWALLMPFETAMFGKTFGLVNSVFGTSLATDLSPMQEQQYQSIWHTAMAVFIIMVVIAHIYIGSVGMEGAMAAMTSGDVDTNWAKEHHSLWVEEEEAKAKAKATAGATKSVDDGSMQPAE